MYPDGRGVVNLTDNDTNDFFPSWSPDGKKIAYASYERGNRSNIYIMNADGTNKVKLANTTDFAACPVWSPDGAKIAYIAERDNEAPGCDIYTINIDGTERKRLTYDGNSTCFLPGHLMGAGLLLFEIIRTHLLCF